MNAIKYTTDTELLACEICLDEIPADEAKNEEAADYVIYYYGLECYARWSQRFKNDEH